MIEWIFILTLGITAQTELDISYIAKTEALCNQYRTALMQEVQAKGDQYTYWYITTCERSSRNGLDKS